ncbi:MAG TPA: hypothetical protein DCQ98_05250 [Planctomycetaceae bacterium]|nr:hypothetical protein [Planctomycetaceae bacterium]HRF02330.1 hypothetical protein [Pirellulaceae bacterium]
MDRHRSSFVSLLRRLVRLPLDSVWELRRLLDRLVFAWFDRRWRTERNWPDPRRRRRRRVVLLVIAALLSVTTAVVAWRIDAPRRTRIFYRSALSAAVERQDWSAAEIANRRLIRAEPDDPALRFLESLLIERREGTEAAMAGMLRLAPLDRIGHVPAHRWIAETLLRRPDLGASLPVEPQERIAAWRHHAAAAFERHPADPHLESLMIALAAAEDPREARELLERRPLFAERRPGVGATGGDRTDATRSLLRRVLLTKWSGEPASSERELERAIESMEPPSDDAEFAAQLALRLASERFDEARAFVDRFSTGRSPDEIATARALIAETRLRSLLVSSTELPSRERVDPLLIETLAARADRKASFDLLERSIATEAHVARSERPSLLGESPRNSTPEASAAARFVHGVRAYRAERIDDALTTWEACASIGPYGIALLNNHAIRIGERHSSVPNDRSSESSGEGAMAAESEAVRLGPRRRGEARAVVTIALDAAVRTGDERLVRAVRETANRLGALGQSSR